MASVSMSIRVDPEIKEQAEVVLNRLGMTLNGSITMFLNQIVRDQAVPLTLSLSSEQSLCADLLKAKTDRENGKIGREAADVLADMERVVKEAEGFAI